LSIEIGIDLKTANSSVAGFAVKRINFYGVIGGRGYSI
jgi:hypothetical protein